MMDEQRTRVGVASRQSLGRSRAFAHIVLLWNANALPCRVSVRVAALRCRWCPALLHCVGAPRKATVPVERRRACVTDDGERRAISLLSSGMA